MTKTVLGVDIGGTFTDLALLEEGRLRVFKLPSTPADPTQAVLEGLQALGVPADADVAHGSTVATNALLEGKGARTALLVTKGFEDLLEIGRQNRPALYDLLVERPPVLVPPDLRIGVEERMDSQGKALAPLTSREARRVARLTQERGAEAVAVSLLFAFLNPRHEALLKEAMKGLDKPPFLSFSSELLPEYREYERTSTVVVNAYVGPVMARYLGRLGEAVGRRLRIMQSGGGSLSASGASREPVRTLLSGPAGGVAGAFRVASQAGFPDVITLDMGGTSTDVSLCPGRIQETTGGRIGGYPVALPMIDIHTVGAGGGSIARLDIGGALLVGPQSAGADPGPACYGRGDQVTVTDANLLLGRLDPAYFLGGRMILDVERSRFYLGELAKQMGCDATTAAEGVLRVANATMERALRTISLERGFDPRQFALLAFGGAGPMHACFLAEGLRIPRVLVPPYPGILSALGVAMADVVKDYSRTVLLHEREVTPERLREVFQPMEQAGVKELREEGFSRGRSRLECNLDMRYVGQSYELTVPCPPLNVRVAQAAARRFHRAHRQRYGYSDAAQPVEVVTARVKAIGLVEKPVFQPTEEGEADPQAALVDERPVVFDGKRWSTPCYERTRLRPGHQFKGPTLVLQMDATTVVPPGWWVRVDVWGNLVVEGGEEEGVSHAR
ncbi:MAG: hydantoinase/oxoprolinase family protein [Dehalococcoidia bacterium]|nr:hydantoinase/oxoprolinase family protein [Dehalococcoidia bacterium]